MAAAIVPLVTAAAPFVPLLITEAEHVIAAVAHHFHKPAGTQFTPAQVTAIDKTSVGMLTPIVNAANATGKLTSLPTEAELLTFIQALYQLKKANGTVTQVNTGSQAVASQSSASGAEELALAVAAPILQWLISQRSGS